MKHRRMLKAALLAMLIALPLILSGCYVEPEDINAGNPGNDVEYPVFGATTNPPVPTSTPAATVTNVPSVAPMDTPAQLPTSAAVVNWTRTVNPLPASTDSGAGNQAPDVTSPPTARPTATPQQGSLKRGSTGQEVKDLQQKLKSLGFYHGSVDGDFGEATEAAVKAFQKQYGLTVDGKAGTNTLAKLAAARQTAKPTASPTPRATATPKVSQNTYLRKGNSGSQVRQMQDRLISLGYLLGTSTGTFDESTEAGVIRFQDRHTSYSDGVAGPDTLNALYASSAKKTSSPAAIIGITLKEGSTNAQAVRLLQQRLKSLGFYTGSVDGDFGAGTTDAVRAFQRANKLTVDGAAGPGTLNKLFSSKAVTASQAQATATPYVITAPPAVITAVPSYNYNGTPIPANTYVQVTSAPSGDYVTLRRGTYGQPVLDMQNALKRQGYYNGNADGYFGDGTEQAVINFQRLNGLQADGVAGPATLRVLFEGAFPFGS
ncbi:MAG: peptidoglycan-binding protein [Clostridia bacterium]|nr:peptidoglycan-binding protein [Clostridia bacterium]